LINRRTAIPHEHLRRHGILLAAIGVLVLSVDSLLIRLAATDGWTILFWRGLFMLFSLATAAWVRDRRAGLTGFRAPLTWLLALLFTLSTAAFVLSIMLTKVANTVVLISAGPLFAALFSTWLLKEKVPLRTWLAIAGACSGVLVVCADSLGQGELGGDLLALGNAVIMGASMTLLRKHPAVSRSVLLAASGALLAVLAAPLAAPLLPPLHSLWVLALMGLVQMPLSLLLLTDATRYLPAPEVSLFLLLETLLAPIWVWLLLGETVPGSTLLGGTLIVAALVTHSLIGLRRDPAQSKL
jgi:drug/metabolite transporter (DMT)-like permease